MAGKAASNKEHPLAGAVLCFTSILPEQRTELASIAGQMGASHSFDLTSDVTHLLVGETNTEKYKFVARERPDIAVLQPEWVEAVRQSWMQGGDTNLRALEDKYKLPTFTGTAICITGFEDLSLRNYIQTNAEMHGADFRKDLTKTVTHLIARTAEGAKYKAATQWNIKVVSYKWFTDCVERGMVLEETLYHPLLPQEQQGAGAWNRSLPVVQPKQAEAESSSGARPRKLRRIASAKLGDQNENIWGDIVGIGFETAAPKPSREERQAANERRQKDASAIQVAKSFASETTFASASQTREPTTEPAVDRQNGFLDGCFFLIHDFSSKQKTVLRNHLLYNGAQLVDSLGDFSRPNIPKRGHGLYIIVPYKTPRAKVLSTDDLAFECEIVTDMWLERCLDTKTLVSPESHIANTPLPSFPIKGLSGMNICSTGFARIDLLHLSKLVNLVGATYNEYLKPTASVLVCNESTSINHEKLRHTQEWGVPAVTAEWLWASIRQEKKQDFDPYLVRKLSTQSSRDRGLRSNSHPENKQPLKQRPRQDTSLRRSTSIANKSVTPESDSVQEPKHTISESPQKESPTELKPKSKSQQKSISPLKPPPENGTGNSSKSPPKRKHPESDSEPEPDRPTTAASTKSALDLAVNGILKHARSANSRSDSNPTGENDRVRSRRPRPLLGRAQSTSSGRAEQHRTFSRASSIDTLHEEGSMSAAESMSIHMNGNSNRFDFEYHNAERERLNGIEEIDETPQMTQLDYEDPDAVAMREEFLRQAGKLVDKPAKKNDLVIGEVKELEQSGWGTGRRTRNARKPINVDDDEDEF
ncbi:BRCT domain-containing protein [Aspergillus unguis]